MTKDELINSLAEFPGDTEIVMSSDGEGNSYSPLAGWGYEWYVPTKPWCGEIWSEEDLAEDEEMDPNAKKVLVLWPTN